jgi:UDP-N-acetylglucosamine 2-epimerase (non-hydrolysing)
MNKTILYSCHPRSKKKITESGFEFHSNIQLHEPFGFWDYIKLQENSYCVISDSGTLPEESAILHFPGVSLRTSTERPEAIDSGVFVIGSISSEEIIQAVEMATAMSMAGDHASVVHAYNDKNISTKVVKIIQSYTPIVNKMIWRKIV